MATRKSITRRKKTPDLRRLAQAAHNDAASVATSLDLLLSAEKESLLDPDTQALITSGIRSKCLTCCGTLQHIDKLLGGEPAIVAPVAPVATEPPAAPAPVAPAPAPIDAALDLAPRKPMFRTKWRKMKMRVLVRDNFTCQAKGCKCKDLARLTVHHIKPKSEGGTNEQSNLVTLCDHHHDELHRVAAKDRQAAYEALIGGAQ